MKLLAATLATVQASHYRGGSYAITQGEAGLVEISRSNTWRRSNSGYSGGCTQSDIDNQVVAQADPEDCWYRPNGSWDRCGYTKGGYIVTDIEDSLSTANNYCYGTRHEDFTKPSSKYEFEWDDCCWVKFTTDDNELVSGGSFGFYAYVEDIDNNSPQTKLPPIWKIMAGCAAQTLELNPYDKDGDTIKCRWADSDEGLGAYKYKHNFASITLDSDTCILTYDGTKDVAPSGVKPIAIHVEDFDSNGVMKSSMPLQFLATVWTPTNSNFRTSGRNQTPYQYPNLFPEDDHDDHKKGSSSRSRGRRSTPDYCGRVPVLEDPSPAAGSVTEVGTAGTTFSLKASSPNGNITKFTYQSAPGVSCDPVGPSGDVACTFTPSSDQVGSTTGFCFQAEDSLGLQTERRCISFNVVAQDPVLYNINDMLDAVDPNGPRAANYGCSGNMDHTAANKGSPIDGMDKALLARKNCLRCAVDNHSTEYEKYSFDPQSNTCLDASGTALRRFCECDKELASVNKLLYNSSFENYGGSGCFKNGAGSGNSICCVDNEYFSKLNGDRYQCCTGGGHAEIGAC